MASQWDARVIGSMKPLATWLGAGISILGITVLLGWAFDVESLKTLSLGAATLKANTALAFVLAGISLWLRARGRAGRQQRIAQACAGVVALIGLVTLLEYVFHWNPIDQLLVRDPSPLRPGYVPGHMSLESACSFLDDGLALFFIDWEIRHRQRPAQWLALTTAVASGLALAGYAFEIQLLYAPPSYGRVALHTAVAFTALSIGILLARPDAGLMKIFTSEGAGGAVARRLVPAAMIVPFILRWISLRANEAGIYGTQFARALETVLITVVLVVLIYWSTKWLDHSDRQRKLAEQSLREAHDQLEHKVQEQTAELRAASTQYRQVIEQVPAITYIAEPGDAGHWHYVSPQIETVLGFTPKEWIANPHLWFQQVQVEDRERVLSQDQRNRRGGDRYQIEYRMRTKDGRRVWIRDDIHVWLNEKGQPLFHGLMVDVTEQKHSEDALRESEKRLRTLSEASFEGLVFSEHGVMVDANDQMAQILGYTRAEMIGTPIMKYVAPQSRDLVIRAIQSGGSAAYEHLALRKDGSIFPVEVCARMMNLGDRKIRVTAVRDITDRKRTEAIIKEAEERFETAFYLNPEGMLISNLQEGRIVDANAALQRMLEYERSELVGKDTHALGIWVDKERRSLLAGRLANGEPIRQEEARYRTKSGRVIDVQISADKLEIGGETCILAIIRDMTQQRALEHQLRQAQKMEAVGRLAGGVAHDFNNFLMIISSAAQMMQAGKHDAARLDRYLGQIQTAADKAASLTKQLLAFSRQQVLRPTVLNLNTVVNDLWKMLPRLLGEDIETKLRLANNLSNVSADRGQIEQVIMNLAVNARDAMPEGGKLIVETADVELDSITSDRHGSEVPPGRYVMLTVSDTGIGIDLEAQAKIFEPFFTTKEIGKGTGLGLATVYGIVKQSAGHVWVYSEIGQGTTFKIYLPRVETSRPSPAQSEINQTALSGSETILLVEDESALREVTSEYLRSKGYAVLEAGNGQEALQVCQNHEGPIHLMLTDVVMPGGGGPNAARSVMNARPSLQVIYMSGYADRLVSAELRGQEMNFLQKPFSLDVLGRKIRSVLNGKA